MIHRRSLLKRLADALQAHGAGGAELLRPERDVELLQHPTGGVRLLGQRLMPRAGRFGLGPGHGGVHELPGLVGLPSPAHITVLVGLGLVQAQQVGLQIRGQARQRGRGRGADEPGVHERGDVFADGLQHREHRQVGGTGDSLVDLGVALENGDHIMRNRVYGILEHLGDVRHGFGQRGVIGEIIDVRQQPFDGGQLQILDKVLGGPIRRGGQHQRLCPQPTRGDAL